MAEQTYSLDDFRDWARKSGRDLSKGNFKKPLKAGLLILVGATKECFQASRSPDGAPWEPLHHPRIEGGDKPLLNHGILEASLSGRGPGAIATIDDAELVYGTHLDRAPIHQYGGIIRPTRAGALSIPLTKEALRAGPASKFPIPLGMVKRPGKNPLLVETKKAEGGKAAKAIFHYVLVKSVEIAARPFLGINRDSVDKITMAFMDFLDGKL